VELDFEPDEDPPPVEEDEPLDPQAATATSAADTRDSRSSWRSNFELACDIESPSLDGYVVLLATQSCPNEPPNASGKTRSVERDSRPRR
jgi:hypothetical protein